jgi:hypothetical protein
MAAQQQVSASSTPCPSMLSCHDPIDGLVAAYAGAPVWSSTTSPTLEECMSPWDPPALTSVSTENPFNDSLSLSDVVGPGQALDVMGDDTLTRSSPALDCLEVMNLGLNGQLVVAQCEDAT